MKDYFLEIGIVGLIIFLLYISKVLGECWLLLAIIFFLFYAIVRYQMYEETKKKNDMKKVLISSFKEYNFTQYFGNVDELISIDKEKKVLALKDKEEQDISVYEFNEIINYEIITDKQTYSKKQGTLSRAIVGGVLFGGLGAVVGGLSGGSESHEKVRKLQLRVTVDDLENPSHTITFIDSPNSDQEYYLKKAITELSKWQSILDIILSKK